MSGDPALRTIVTRVSVVAAQSFIAVELFAYLVLGLLLVAAALLGMGSAALALWSAVLTSGETRSLILAVDRLLFVLMIVEILHTVRVSFRSGKLVCEPFLVVGLIASIRRVLVITLESAEVHQPGSWTPAWQAQFASSMLELGVLGGLILVMVTSIGLLRFSQNRRAATNPPENERVP
jgi:uncharacterized membrane protein (DUF373 family)